MKKFASFILASLASAAMLSSCNAQVVLDEPVEIGPYTVTMIESGVWHIEDCTSANPAGVAMVDGRMHMNNCSDMYIVRGKKAAILIDLSNRLMKDDAAASLVKIFNERAEGVERYITITHNHGDHTGMLYAFQEDNDVKYLLPANDFKQPYPGAESRTSFINDGSDIDLGGMVLNCVEVKGHTPGSMVFFLHKHNICFSGDAIGSGSGAWIFSKDGFLQYAEGVAHLHKYVNNKASKVDTAKLIFYSGHMWQRGDIPELTYQYLDDMNTLVAKVKEGTAEREPYSTAQKYLDSNFKYGMATITWNEADAKSLLE